MEYDTSKAGGDSKQNDGCCGEERFMVKFELEAAEALAGLAHSGNPEDESAGPSQRVKHGSSPPPHDLVTLETSDQIPQQDRARPEKLADVITEPVKDEKVDSELKPGFSSSSSTSYLSVGVSKSRHPLTEIEKEARRLRRVLANRESARQTIRRRQAMFEELTRKAADLALENESLKREKELAGREYNSLKNTNDCLKEKMAKLVKPKADEIQEESKRTNAGCSASPCPMNPFFPYNQPSAMPLHRPPIIRTFDAPLLQWRSPSDIANPSVFSMTHSSSDQRESTIVANPETLLYVLPFPCFFPLHSPTNALHPLSSDKIFGQDETYLNNQCVTSCSSKSIELGDDNLHQDAFGFPPDGGGKGKGTYPNRMVLTPTSSSGVSPLGSADEGLNATPRQEGTSNLAEKGVPKDNQEPVVDS